MLASSAEAADVDWKMYGGASVGGPSYCFYDAKSVAHTSNGNMRVWTKCLTQKDLDGLNIKSDIGRKIVDNAARKLVDKYVPPIAAAGMIDADQIITAIQYEETANLSSIEPEARFFMELNCSERMDRRLSTYLNVNGKVGFENMPSDWEYVPPEGSSATLLKILCRVP
jgi:hypothetical protein